MKRSPTAKKKGPAEKSKRHRFMEVKNLLDFRMTVTAMANISVSPGRPSGGKPVVELCGTVNFKPSKQFAEKTARLAQCIADGSHKLVNNIKVVTGPDVDPDTGGPTEVMCCCPNGGCIAVQGHCPPCD